MAKAAGGKSGKYKNKQLRPLNVIIDPDFFTERSKIEMLTALKAKFLVPGLAQDILQATDNAQLWHGTRGTPNARQFILEYVRSLI